jgi:hypothetical protein
MRTVETGLSAPLLDATLALRFADLCGARQKHDCRRSGTRTKQPLTPMLPVDVWAFGFVGVKAGDVVGGGDGLDDRWLGTQSQAHKIRLFRHAVLELTIVNAVRNKGE